jgi:hypothetical protein
VGSYTLGEVSRITGVSRARLRYWERTSLLERKAPEDPGELPSRGDGGGPFAFRDLVSVRSVLSLLDRGVSLRRIRHSVADLRRHVPDVDEPLASLRAWGDGSPRVVVRHQGALVEPSGQLVLDFSESPSGDKGPVAFVRPPTEEAAELRAMDCFERGCKLDSNRETFGEAIEAYQQAIESVPDFADAHCNLGSVYFNQDRMGLARECFLRALHAEPRHIEANLNVATLLEEEGQNRLALHHYRVALEVDPLSADTHVSLALLYEKIGLRRKARDHWRRYLQLDPAGTWVDIARQRLDER